MSLVGVWVLGEGCASACRTGTQGGAGATGLCAAVGQQRCLAALSTPRAAPAPHCRGHPQHARPRRPRTPQRNAELVKLQEEAAARQEGERLRVEQQIQAERRAAEQYAVRGGGRAEGGA